MSRGSNTARNYFRPRKPARKLQAVDRVLASVMKKYGIDQELARYRFVLHWDEIVGAEIAKRAKPERIENGALVVRVCNSAWSQELSFQKKVILHRLKKYIDKDETVDDVLFYVGDL